MRPYVDICISGVFIILMTPGSLSAQLQKTSPAPLTFEVASVKLSPPDAPGSLFGCHGTDVEPMTMASGVPLGRCVYRHFNFRNLVMLIYPDLSPSFRVIAGIDEQVKGGPGWVGSSFFDVEGEAANPSATTTAQLQEMLRALLKDRFQLSFHIETREMSAYVIVPAKEGPKLKESAGPATPEEVRRRPARALFMPNTTLSDFATMLSIYMKTPVVDKTGLTRKYTMAVNSFETGDDTAASIFTALPEQLGLRLEAQKVGFQVFVIDRLEKPAEN